MVGYQVVIRTDASLQIGTGHVMRCLTLAAALQSAGAQCHFICRDHSGNLIDLIRQHGYRATALPAATEACLTNSLAVDEQSAYSAWLGVDWTIDVQQTKVAIGAMAVDWLIVDHYSLEIRWEQVLRPLCHRLMVIDDLADRPHVCDLLLDQNLGRGEGDYTQLVPEGCTVLVGPRYALLRPEFSAFRDYSMRRRTTPQLKHLLITMGGVDQTDATSSVLEALQDCSLPADMRITVVMGPHAPWLKHVQLLALQMPRPTEVKVSVSNMAELMAASDLAIGAAGSTSWERCCLGLPTLMVVLADNQKEAASHLERAGAANWLRLDIRLHQQIEDRLHCLLNQSEQLSEMSFHASEIADGKGADRIADIMVINSQDD